MNNNGLSTTNKSESDGSDIISQFGSVSKKQKVTKMSPSFSRPLSPGGAKQ